LGRPVAITCSLGTNLGGHSGFTLLEEYLGRIGKIVGVAVCCAAGNESTTRHHFTSFVSNRGTTEIELRVEKRGENIYLCLWNTPSARLSVSIKTPTGEIINRVPSRTGVNHQIRLIFERTNISVEYFFPTEGTGGQMTLIKLMETTVGIWTITVHGDFVSRTQARFHAWLPITGFIDPGTVFMIPEAEYTIVTPATSLGINCIGAYNSSTNSLAAFTSWGPSMLPFMFPALVAPGVDVGGIFPGGRYGAMSGTSAAAAITAGACALVLEWGIVRGNEITMNTTTIRGYMFASSQKHPGVNYPNSQWGFGRLDLFNLFDFLRTR